MFIVNIEKSIKWPKFMQKCMMTTMLDTHINKLGYCQPTYPVGHALYLSMGKNAKALKDANSLIWNEVIFQFKKPMMKEYHGVFQTQAATFVTFEIRN